MSKIESIKLEFYMIKSHHIYDKDKNNSNFSPRSGFISKPRITTKNF